MSWEDFQEECYIEEFNREIYEEQQRKLIIEEFGMFNILDEYTEKNLIEFIEGKRKELVIYPDKEFDIVMKILEERNIETYSFLDAGEAVIQKINKNDKWRNKKNGGNSKKNRN